MAYIVCSTSAKIEGKIPTPPAGVAATIWFVARRLWTVGSTHGKPHSLRVHPDCSVRPFTRRTRVAFWRAAGNKLPGPRSWSYQPDARARGPAASRAGLGQRPSLARRVSVSDLPRSRYRCDRSQPIDPWVSFDPPVAFPTPRVTSDRPAPGDLTVRAGCRARCESVGKMALWLAGAIRVLPT
jgi:hypothetical protein